MTSLKQAFIHIFIKNPTNASGRASRSEFWWGMLFFALCALACYGSAVYVPHAGYVIAALLALVSIWLLIITLIRRIHDNNKSALIFLLPILPIAVLYQLTGEYYVIPETFSEPCVAAYALSALVVVYIIYLLCKRGTLSDNRFGADPLLGPTNAKAKQAAKQAAKKQAEAEAKAQVTEEAVPESAEIQTESTTDKGESAKQ